MKTNIPKIGAALLAVGICICCTELRAQVTTTESVTTSNGAFTEFVPASETVVIKSETNPAPLRYVVTKQTTIVDEAGVPIAVEKITPGSPLEVQYATTGDRLVASRIVVHHAAAVNTAPVATERRTSTTTTTTTRSATEDEREAAEERREDRKERIEEGIEKRQERVDDAAEREKERLEKLKDKVEDDG